MGDRFDETASMAAALAGTEDTRAAAFESDGARIAGLLLAARQRSGQSLEKISRTTKISTRYLEAMESGHLDVLPAGVYRRAMVRDYARCVGLDPNLVLQPPSAPGDSDAPAASTPASTQPHRHERNRDVAFLPALPRWSPSLPSVALGIVLGAGLATFVADRGVGYETVADRPATIDSGQPAARDAAAAASRARVPEGAPDGAATSGTAPDIRLEPMPVIPVNEPTRLVVTSNPAGARVTVDGVGWGVTPLTIRHLPPGDRIVRVTKDGFLAREQRVRVEGSASVRLTLRPRG